MKPLLAAAAITMIAMTAACNGGGGGAMSLDEYFRELESIEAEAERETDELDSPFDEDDTSLDARKQRIADGFVEFRRIFEDYQAQFDELDPPDEVADLHEDYDDVQDEFMEQFTLYIEGFADAESNEAFDEAAESTLADAELERAAEICDDLENVAEENEIEVDLRCS
jgi:hypothetical protein